MSAPYLIRLRLSNAAGSESVTFPAVPGLGDRLTMSISTAIARLMHRQHDISWQVGPADTVPPGEDADATGDQLAALDMVVRWLA